MNNPNPRIIVVDHEPTVRDVPPYNNEDREEAIQLEWLVRLMDSLFLVPGTNIRFGLDAVLGLIPALGDTATSIVSLYILQSASRQGVSRLTMTRMVANVAIDYVVGSVPVLGDVFDVYWKANQKNLELMKAHTSSNSAVRRQVRSSDRVFLAGLASVLGVFIVGSLVIAYLIASWIISLISTPAGPR